MDYLEAEWRGVYLEGMWKVPFAFVAALVAGFAGAKWVPDEKRTSTEPSERWTKREERRVVRWQADDFEKWATGAARLSGPFSGKWKEWSDEELRAALDEGVKDPGAAMDLTPERKVMSALLGEWMRRDPDSALAWFEGMVSESMRWGLVSSVSENWPPDRAEEGLEYVIAHRDWFESDDSSGSARLIRGVIDEAAKEGAEAVGELLGKLRENRLDWQFGDGWQFPPDFDFSALAKHPEVAGMKTMFFAGIWMSRDPEGAFAHLIGGVPPGDAKVRGLFNDVLPRNGPAKREEAAARVDWLTEKIRSLPDGERTEIASRISMAIDDPETRGRFVGGVDDEAARKAVIPESMDLMGRRGARELLSFVDHAFEGEARLDALEDMKPGVMRDASEAARAVLEAKLAEWNAPPDRARMIMEKFPNPFR